MLQSRGGDFHRNVCQWREGRLEYNRSGSIAFPPRLFPLTASSGSIDNGPEILVRIVKIAVGFLLLIAGVAMLALPGPGWLSIAAGLALLAADFVWARRALDGLKKSASKLRRH